MPPRPRVEPTDDWLPVLRLPAYAPRRPRPTGAVQPPLFPVIAAGDGSPCEWPRSASHDSAATGSKS